MGLSRNGLELLHTNRFVCVASEHQHQAKRFKVHDEKENRQ